MKAENMKLGMWLGMAGLVLAGMLPREAAAKGEVCTNALTTSWGRAVTPENCWREYPRPQLVRSQWTSLNGRWDYAITSVTTDEPTKWDGKILVPYPIESPLSGVGRKVTPDDQIWYRRTFRATPQKGMRTILNFERVDFRASVFVNGIEATDAPHEGGNVPFSMDVTELVRPGENELKVLVWDPTDTHLGGTGKQVLKYWTCFFGASSGIVGGVWLETVPETYLADYRVTTDLAKGTVTIEPEVKGGGFRTTEVKVSVLRKGKELVSGNVPAGEALTLALPRPLALWSCEEPNLYDLALTVAANGREDRATGYFGLREVGTKLDAQGHRRVTVNGKFTYLLATLDQGWWPDGLLTPPSEEACRFDVEFHKKAAFNAIRKHIKIEPRAFYAHCDRIGVMVLQDIPSFGPDNRQHDLSYANKRYGFYRQELKACVDHLRNHPSIVMWIPYNEGWGQPSADKTRFTNKWLRRYDPTRLINGPSGWNDYEGGSAQFYTHWANADRADPNIYTDLVDLHCYPGPNMHPADGRRVSFLGEFGGMGVALRGHVQNPKGGAHTLTEVSDPSWRKGQERAYQRRIDPLPDYVRKGLGGSVYTEAIDQFWELGGFVTFDRAIVKLDYAFLRRVHQRVYDAAKEAAETPPPPPPTAFGIDWDPVPQLLDLGEWPRLKVLSDGRYAFTYARTAGEFCGSVVRFSTDKGRTWSLAQVMIPGFTRPNGANGEATYSALNTNLAELPPTHPKRPGRLIASANLRPVAGVKGAPSSIGYAVSDDGGRTWSAMRALLPLAGDAAAKGGHSCWEPFIQVRPDGTLDLYYSDVVKPRPDRGFERTVSRFVSTDAGETWRGPEVVAYRPGTGAGIPVPLAHGDKLYLSFEAYPTTAPWTPPRPWIALTSAKDPWKTAPLFFSPLRETFANDEIVGAPFLTETANYYLLSAQVGRPRGKRVALSQAQMRVWAMPKGKEGPKGELAAFVPVENPLGERQPMYWNGLTPLGGDDVMATCQRGAELFLVHGRIRKAVWQAARPVWPAGKEREWNSFCALRGRFAGGADLKLRITAAYDYRVLLNGKFVGFGPVRGPEGVFRIDTWPLATKPGENVIEIEAAGYNCNSYYYINQPSFVQAEVLSGDTPLLATGRNGDFAPYEAGRVRKVPRYTSQRTYMDAWRVGDAVWGREMNLALAEQPMKRYEERPLAYPTFALNDSFRPLRKERLVRDPQRKIARQWFIEKNPDPLRNQFLPEELEANPYYDLQRYRRAPLAGNFARIAANESVTFEGDRNAAGFIGLKVRTTGPCRIVLSWDEMLCKDGSLDFSRLGCASTAEWRLGAAGEYALETFEPYAAKFIDVAVLEGAAEVEKVWIRSYVSPLADKTSFRASDPALEKIFRAARESYRANAVDGFTDCPTRERAYWSGDTFFTGRASAWLTGDGRVERTFLANFLLAKGFDWSRYDSKGVDMTGAIPALYPGGVFWGNFIPNYMIWTVMQLEEYVSRTGDRAFADAAKPSVLGMVAFLRKFRNADGLLEKLPGWVFVEWSRANSLVQDVNYPSNMMYARLLDVCANLYGLADMAAEAAAVKREIIRQSWNGEWFCDNAVRGKDGQLRLSGECTETCQYSAFFFNTITPESHPALWRKMLDEFGPDRVKKGAYKKIWPSNFIFGTCERLDLLSRAGRSAQILAETRDWFLTMAERTGTLWEHLDTRASCCHGFSSIASEYLFRDILGIRAIDRVAKTVRFAPAENLPLEWCEGTLPLAPGAIATFRWCREQGKLRTSLTLPPGWTSR